MRADSEPCTSAGECLLTTLPAELIASIFSYLAPDDLSHMAETCRVLYRHATEDRLWRTHVQANVPGQKVTSAYPFASFRELYSAHNPHWFVAKYKLWFSDTGLPGRIVLTRYDQRRGCIEGYQLLANNTNSSFHTWHAHGDTIISGFSPKVKLHLDSPALHLPAHPTQTEDVLVFPVHQEATDAANGDASGASSGKPHGQDGQAQRENDFQSEILMHPSAPNRLQSSFVYARCLSPDDIAERSGRRFPYSHVWPPPAIPSPRRVLGAGLERPTSLRDQDRAQSRREVYDRAFRLHKWLQMHDFEEYIPSPNILTGDFQSQLDLAIRRTAQLPRRITLGEEVSTFATLDPAQYTPTPTKPFRGIWVGDYGAHGCEFLWLHQPDDDPADAFNPERGVGESDAAYAARKRDAAVYRGRLEAVKLTGDANVPRGEYSFVVDDLGEGGLVRVETEAPFEGARVVKSRGHIANNGFSNDTYVDAELFLVSPDVLAHNWLALGHISYFHRVDIDSLIVPN
ncbi:hypothetical protein C8A01DRAFT_18846 [Parachaetomium inaequale]|uniref:F-box domain-containing protein n=1 Tax=Parachaetomium inaequale TaxID=2588326 RepID=A0AAN6PE76_9PEZI|nr:hypothetical protein C8A01DRAFT_18846 [Parachaetomium inaequale]